MASETQLPDWLQRISEQLEEQYRVREAPFEGLVNAYLESLQREEASLDQQDVLEEQLQKLQVNLGSTREELELLKKNGSGSSLDNRKFFDLENKYRLAKQERMELLRTQSINSQKLLELTEQVKGQEFVCERLQLEIKRLQTVGGEVDKKLNYYIQLVEEKNLNIQILQDELQALQLELLQNDERVKTLERENQQLVQRWLSKVSETMEKLNAEVEECSPRQSFGQIEMIDKVQKKISLDQPISGLITSPYNDLLIPLVKKPDDNNNSRIIFYRNLEDSGSLSSTFGNGEIKHGTFSRDCDLFIGVDKGNGDGDGNSDGVAKIWSIESGKVMGSIGTSGLTDKFLNIIPISSTNTAVVTLHHGGSKSLGLYDLPRTFCLWNETLDVAAIQISPLKVQNTDLVAVLLEDGRINLWDIRQRKVARKSSHQMPKVFSLATDIYNSSLLTCTDRSINAVDTGNLRIIRTIQHPSMSFGGNYGIRRDPSSPPPPLISISPMERKKFALAFKDKIIYGDYSDGTIEAFLGHHESEVVAASWISSNGGGGGDHHHPILVTADVKGTMALCDVI